MSRRVSYSVGILVGLIFLAGMLGCSRSPSGPTDASIAEALKSKFYSDPALASDRVEVVVQNGVVTLQGDVSSDTARLQAYKLAVETPGVQKVNDQMQVKPPAVAQQVQPTNIPPSEARVLSQGKGRSSKPSKPVSPPSLTPEVAEGEAENRPEPKPSEPLALPAPALAAPEAPKPVVAPLPPPPPPPRMVTLPSGTSFRVQMIDSVNSDTQKIGEKYQASLQSPIVIDNEVIVPKGSDITVMLTDAQSAGKISGRSELRLKLDTLKFQGKSYPLDSSTYEQVGQSRGKDTAKKVALGAAIGTAIGAIAGGGKGAAIGAGVGAGGGTAVQVLTRGKQVQIPSETILDFQLEQPVEITILPGQNRRSR